MNLNALPVIGWGLSLFFSVSLSVPFWFLWTSCGLGERYFYWLPDVYRSIPFWHCVGLFIVIGILKSLLTPHLAEVNQTNKKEE